MIRTSKQNELNMPLNDINKYDAILTAAGWYTPGPESSYQNDSWIDQIYEAISETCTDEVAKETAAALETIKSNIDIAFSILRLNANSKMSEFRIKRVHQK